MLNLDDTIAVTQNFCSKTNFERVWRSTRDGRRGMARKFLRVLREVHPDLFERAQVLNVAEGWDMHEAAEKHRKRVVSAFNASILQHKSVHKSVSG